MTAAGPGTPASTRSVSFPGRLSGDALHVWEADLDRRAEEVQALRALLSGDELGHADRLGTERARSRYVAGRGLLRLLLGRYLQRPAAEIAISYGENGKPQLSDAALHFNLTHSSRVALLGFSARAPLGVDLELDGDDRDDHNDRDDHEDGDDRDGRADRMSGRLAERFFSAGEVRALRALPAADRPRAFLTCWTRKEAFIKARGDGLSLRLDSFDVSLGPGSAPQLLRTAWSAHEPGHWQVRDLSEPDRGYIAALAIRSPRVDVHRLVVPDRLGDGDGELAIGR